MATIQRYLVFFGLSGENIEVVSLAHGQFLMPGLIDTHTHAPQFTFLGIGHDLPLMDWLNKYTFKHESEFKDNQWARKMYTEVINRVVRNGVTFAAYYGTIHVEATCILAEVIRSVGQRAYVGKVCMDANSPDYYSESTAESLEDSKEFVRRILNAETANAHGDQQKGQHIPLIKPIITPRFVPSCTGECLAGLSELAHKHELPIQSHLCENPSEVDFAKSCFPDCTSYSSIYDKHGLLKQGTIMAHCVHMSDEDLRLIRATGAGISHCPNSNFSLASGTADVHRFLSEGIPVGLGTDVGGGYSPSIIDSMRMAAAANRTLLAYKRDRGDFLEGRSAAPLEFSELIFLATQGGAQVMGMRDNLGSLEAGKLFDAIVVDLDVPRSPVPSSTFTPAVIAFGEGSVDAWRLRLEQFVFLADDRNIARVFVNGRLIHSV
ncbi:amidohydrolase family protein [Coemansia spiralis]|nr:amidohydrolase family protein [Coemansia spiralis]